MNYDEIKAINWSSLKYMLESPAHFKYFTENQPAQTPAQKLGIAIHEAILEPEKFGHNYYAMPEIDGRTKEGKAAKAALAEKPGEGLAQKDFEKILNIREAVMSSPHAWILDGCEKEAILCAEYGSEQIKGRLDIVNNKSDFICDVKTTASANPKDFNRDFFKFSYHCQAAWYSMLYMCNYHKQPDFYFLALEKDPPYPVTLFHVPADVIDYGTEIIKKLLRQYIDCKKSDYWPPYSMECETIFLPEYLKK